MPVDIFIDPQTRADDISTTEHELIHLMKTEGLIQEDIVVPVASAQTTLSLHLSGENLVSTTEHSPFFEVTSQTAGRIDEVVKSAQSPWEFYYHSLVPPKARRDLREQSLAHLNMGLSEVYRGSESKQTYVMGTWLGYALVARENYVGSGYAQSFLASIAHGDSLFEAEICGQIMARSAGMGELNTTRKKVKDHISNRNLKLNDADTYDKITGVVREIG